MPVVAQLHSVAAYGVWRWRQDERSRTVPTHPRGVAAKRCSYTELMAVLHADCSQTTSCSSLVHESELAHNDPKP